MAPGPLAEHGAGALAWPDFLHILSLPFAVLHGFHPQLPALVEISERPGGPGLHAAFLPGNPRDGRNPAGPHQEETQLRMKNMNGWPAEMPRLFLKIRRLAFCNFLAGIACQIARFD